MLLALVSKTVRGCLPLTLAGFFLFGWSRREHVPARPAEKYPVAAVRIEHLVKRCSTDDLFVWLSLLWTIRHGTSGAEVTSGIV